MLKIKYINTFSDERAEIVRHIIKSNIKRNSIEIIVTINKYIYIYGWLYIQKRNGTVTRKIKQKRQVNGFSYQFGKEFDANVLKVL